MKLPIGLFIIVLESVANSEEISCPPTGANPILVGGLVSSWSYASISVDQVYFEFALNETVDLTSFLLLPITNPDTCAKAAVIRGMNAFRYNGTCTGYRLNERFLSCQTGVLDINVTLEYLNSKATVVPFEEAPFKMVDIGFSDLYRQYMLSDLVEIENEIYFYTDLLLSEMNLSLYSFATRENGEITAVIDHALDVNSCFYDGAYGIPLLLSRSLYTPPPIVYLFSECGKTINIPRHTSRGTVMNVYSHAKFGCAYYPTERPDECTTTFTAEDTGDVVFGFLLTEVTGKCTGLKMTVTKISNGETEVRNACVRGTTLKHRANDTYVISLLSHPTVPAVGFYARFF